MTKLRNVRDRQLLRYARRAWATDLRNGVQPDGYDPRRVGQALPWCVEAYLARGPIIPRMSTRDYGREERRRISGGCQGTI
jgi:hypothetical protein